MDEGHVQMEAGSRQQKLAGARLTLTGELTADCAHHVPFSCMAADGPGITWRDDYFSSLVIFFKTG
jgi:hypothetical protein